MNLAFYRSAHGRITTAAYYGIVAIMLVAMIANLFSFPTQAQAMSITVNTVSSTESTFLSSLSEFDDPAISPETIHLDNLDPSNVEFSTSDSSIKFFYQNYTDGTQSSDATYSSSIGLVDEEVSSEIQSVMIAIPSDYTGNKEITLSSNGYTLTYPNAGTTSDDVAVDLIISVNNIKLYTTGNSLSGTNDDGDSYTLQYISSSSLFPDNPFTCSSTHTIYKNGINPSSKLSGYSIQQKITCSVVEHDTSTAVSGTYIFAANNIDVDRSSWDGLTSWSANESVTLNSGFSKNTWISSAAETWENGYGLDCDTDTGSFEATYDIGYEDSTWETGFIAETSGTSFSFTWTGSRCKTTFFTTLEPSIITASIASGSGTITEQDTTSSGKSSTVTVNAAGKSNESTVYFRNSRTYTITPAINYALTQLSIDGTNESLSASEKTSGTTYDFDYVTTDHTLIATFSSMYSIAYDGNDPDTDDSLSVSGSMQNQTDLISGSNVTLNTNEYSYTGYTWTSWNTKADGSGTSYSNEQVISGGFSTSAGGTITLYAQWEPITYEIAFDANDNYISEENPNAIDADGTMENQELEYDIEETLNPNQYTRTNYTFTGWNTEEDGSGTSYTDEESVLNLTSADGTIITLYAQWEAIFAPFTFTKVSADDTDTALEGAEFSLYHYLDAGSAPTSTASLIDTTAVSDSLWELTATATSDENGIVTFKRLQAGEYYRLVETKAPDEYALSAGQWNITFSAQNSENIEWSITAVEGTTSPLAFGVTSDGTYYLPNSTVEELPSTGVTGNGLLFPGVGLALIGAGISTAWYIKNRRKRAIINRLR